jgi:AraC-like DNA-binding protein
MVTTTEIFPAPVLQPFVRCYTLRKFNTHGMVMPRPLYALHEFYFTFFLKDKYCYMLDGNNNISQRWTNCLYSLFTEPTDCSYFNVDFITFCVQFKPNGFFSVFGIPQKLLTNALLPIQDILGNDASLVAEQLGSSSTLHEMGEHINRYLVRKLKLQKRNWYANTISGISNIIYRNRCIVNMDSLANHANMSLRNFERKFIYEVGMPLKLYSRVTRFNNAIENKMLHPYKSWTSVAYECGYYDQMHLIKEFREFSSKAPEELFKYTPPPTENYTARAEP